MHWQTLTFLTHFSIVSSFKLGLASPSCICELLWTWTGFLCRHTNASSIIGWNRRQLDEPHLSTHQRTNIPRLGLYCKMDNISRLYRARYEEAEKSALDGHHEEALDICWELRLCSDLSLYRRACVNLLIASIVNVRTHPDCDKFAQECIELVEQIR